MAIPFLNNINLSDNQLQNAKLHITSTAPTAAAGQIYFDSTADPGGDPPTYDLTAKYYSNSTDNWVSLKEYTFPAVLAVNGYITSVITGTTPKPIITFDLNAVDGAAIAADRYLTKSNKWAAIAAIPGTYAWTISDNVTPTAGTAGVASGNTLQIAASSDLTSTLTGQATTTKVLTVGLKVDGGPGVENNYIVNQGSATAAADDTIPFNNFTDDANPALITNIVNKTTFGTIPVDALTLVKNYIDTSVAGGLIYQGGYDATTNTPDLTTTPNSIKKGWTYTVTVEGTFYGEQLRVGDVLISEVNNPTALADWTTVQNNIDFATAGTDAGVGNPAAVIGISRYDEDDFTVSSTGFVQLNTSYATTITDTATVSHSLGTKDVIIQLYDVTTDETVYADVERASTNTATITFAATPTNSVRVLVQKIG